MELSQQALIAREKGEVQKAEDLAKEAFNFEIEAAELIPESESSEPTRSILYQSSASLAFQFRDFQTARRLIAKGLSGYPPPIIQNKLNGLLQQINFGEHLEEDNMVLEDNDLKLSLDGKNISYGSMPYSEFVKRIHAMNSLFDRTTQWMMKKPYQKVGRVSSKYKPYTPYISAPIQGSFAVIFKLVVPKEQQMYLDVTASKLIDEIIKGFELINSGSDEELKKHINDDAYYANFVYSSRMIAPDGDGIELVGLSSKSKNVNMTKSSKEIDILSEIEKEEEIQEPIKLRGVLDYAISRTNDTIGLTADNGTTYNILVRKGMDDLVRSYYLQFVTIRVTRIGEKLYLDDIEHPVND